MTLSGLNENVKEYWDELKNEMYEFFLAGVIHHR
jgi:hypothetical protein